MAATRSRGRVLIVDDDPGFLADAADLLGDEFQITATEEAGNVIDAVQEQHTDVVLLDIDLGCEESGLDVLERIQQLDDPPRVIMITGDERVQTVVQCIQGGATDYVCKPPNPVALSHRINRCLEEISLARKTRWLCRQSSRSGDALIAEDPRSVQLLRQVERVAPSSTTVLITGESGVGKEMVARSVHQFSRRAQETFLAVNCTAISPTLMESTLFGHEKGAFTGAVQARPGQFELADRGTLFLDEVGDSPAELQQKLLRVLESGRFHRLGGLREISTDVRVIAATNANLENLLAEGRFREDLYHRLNVYRLHVSPLRCRPGDILPLARKFLMQFAADQGKTLVGFTPHAEQYLLSSRWPGNVRDLRNAVERAVINCQSPRVKAGDLVLGSRGMEWAMLPRDEAKRQAEREFYVHYLTTQLALAGGSIKAAAERSGILPQSFSRLCRQYGVR